MDSIRIQGLKSLKDTGELTLKPLTILLGENSAGKSTFLRTFPLIKQSITSNTRGPLLWYGSYVDFGDFSNSLSKFSEDETIKFNFGINLEEFKETRYRFFYTDYINRCFLGKLNFNVAISKDKKTSERVSEIEIKFHDANVTLGFGKNRNSIQKAVVNGSDFTELFSKVILMPAGKSGILPNIRFENNSEKMFLEQSYLPYPLLNPEIYSILFNLIEKEYVRKGTKVSKIVSSIIQCDISSNKRLHSSLMKASETKSWKQKIGALSPDSKEIEEIKSLIFALNIPSLLLVFNNYISGYFSKISYIAPLRATAERYYRTQNLGVDEVDHQGSNLPMFIDNLPESQRVELNQWMQENFGFSLKLNSPQGHLSLFLHYEDASVGFNIADMGFGFSQILPILIQLWFTQYKRTTRDHIIGFDTKKQLIVVEQPELHLHPRIQAKLINAFVKAINFCNEKNLDLKIIIETHSETIINHVGRMIANGTFAKDQTQIVIFEKESQESYTSVKKSNYDQDGCLTDWPWGFFDTE